LTRHARRVTVPDVRYARSRGAHVAFQVMGNGPIDLVLCIGSGVPSLFWEEPWTARFLRRLSSFARLITFDQRGGGRSDPIDLDRPPTVEDRMTDLLAVLDAVGSPKATLAGVHDGGPVSILFAATHPDRVESLLLCNTWARLPAAPDYAWGVAPDILELGVEMHAAQWGTGESLRWFVPSLADDPTVLAGWARHEQLSHSPGQGAALSRIIAQLDVRDILSAIRAPTLVMHTSDNLIADVRHGKYLAEHIADAKWVELPGADHLLYVSADERFADEIEEFLTGERQGHDVDRVLATVLFTDIVESTPRVAAAGDHRWASTLDVHDDVVRRELAVYRGEHIESTGDGFFATFDGPARAVRCAQSIVQATAQRRMNVRTGLHTGEVLRRGGHVSGITVHVANRVAAAAGAAEVVVSSTVRDLVAGSGLRFESMGVQQLKGVPEPKELFRVLG
jgi:pimeloyl-ACP methyl ester carboxylesterase